MSMRDIFGSAIDALRRGEPMQIQLPNGTVINGVPEPIFNEPDKFSGQPFVRFHVSSDGHAGAMEGALDMLPDTFNHMLDQTERLAPRLTMVQRKMLVR